MIQPIDAQTVAIDNAADLNTVVSANNTVNYIYLNGDITLTGGISILASKTALTIDGDYNGVRHSFTDVNDSDATHTLGVFGTSSIAITLKNMDIFGRNYFGVPYIASNFWPLDTSGVSVSYENVTYTGAQMTYNRYGLTRYTDCTITITPLGASPAEEVGEVCRVEFRGHTTINHTSSSDAVFWFNNTAGNSSFTVQADAEVTVVSPNSYFMYNHDLLTLAPVNYRLESGAALNLTVNKGFCFDSSHTVNSFVVGEGAAFRYIQTANNGTNASMYVTGSVQAGAGSDFYMQAENDNASLLYFTGSRNLTVSNPHSFVLYNARNPALHSTGTTTLSLTGGQVNTWDAATVPVSAAGGLDDRPSHKWFKAQYASAVVFTGSFTASATSATGNLTTADEPHPPDSDLRLHTAPVLSIGDFPLTVSTIRDNGNPVSGTSEAGANVRAEYEVSGTAHTLNGVAEPDGSYAMPTTGETPANIPADTVVTVSANIPFLIKSVTAVAVEDTGELTIIEAPVRIPYSVNAVFTSPLLLPRRDPTVPVVISDTRTEESQWALQLAAPNPLLGTDGHSLTNAIVFRYLDPGNNPVLVTLDATPITVHIGGPGVPTTNVFWPVEQGILIHVTEPLHLGVEYSSDVIWTVIPV